MNLSCEYVVEGCIHCGHSFAITADFQRQLKNNHSLFYCPACGELMYYQQKSDKELLQARLAAEERSHSQCTIQRETAENSLRTTKGVVTKLRKQLEDGKEAADESLS